MDENGNAEQQEEWVEEEEEEEEEEAEAEAEELMEAETETEEEEEVMATAIEAEPATEVNQEDPLDEQPLQSELIFAPCPDCDDDQILFYGDYSSGPRYANHRAHLTNQQHWRSVLEGQCNPSKPGKENKNLDRLARVWPRMSIYRDTTGQTSRFHYLS